MKIYKNISIIAITAILGLSLNSCDKVSAPYKEKIEKPDTKQKVLLEDYTGHTCTYCPGAQELAHELADSYGEENLIIVAIHAGALSVPLGDPFTYDFRTSAGSEYYTYFSIQNTPNGMVNRANEDGVYVLLPADWGTQVATQFEVDPTMELAIDATIQDGKVSGNINIDFTSDINTEAFVQIWITEDGIIKPQVESGEVIMEYVHNHVLRAAVNGTWGQALASASYSEGDSETISFSNFQIGDDWVADQLSIVAFVYDNDTKKVIQVEKKKIIE